MVNKKIIDLKSRLNRLLPGEAAQLKMAPDYRHEINRTVYQNEAAVMILLYPVNGNLTTVFMKRTEYPGAHSGQISFPGGKFDTGDGILLNTALRETREEFGIPEKDIEIIGSLTPLHIPVSGFKVYPFVGYINSTPIFKIDTTEVAYLIETEIDSLMLPSIKKTEFQIHGKFSGMVPFFEIKNNKIWGATAMILNEFIESWNTK